MHRLEMSILGDKIGENMIGFCVLVYDLIIFMYIIVYFWYNEYLNRMFNILNRTHINRIVCNLIKL